MKYLKALLTRILTKNFIKNFSLIFGVMALTVVVIVLLNERTSIYMLLTSIGLLIIQFFILFIGYVFVYALVEFDSNKPDILDNFLGKIGNTLLKSIFMLLKIILICAVAYGVFYLVGGIAGILKFGWSQL